jgi:DNA-directed RNA polymerase subunit RPC12/RpoP
VFDYVCERCGRTWHSAASEETANERGGCERCGGRLRSADQRPAPTLKLVEPVGGGDDWGA